MAETMSFEDYLILFNKLALEGEKNPLQIDEILKLIDTQKNQSKGLNAIESFYQGEYYFVTGHFELALKDYLQAKSIPNFQFFCFRASAYLSKKQGLREKAINFAKKALSIYPLDYYSQIILEKLSTPQAEESFKDRTATKYLGQNEIMELGNIFQERNEKSKELFAEELHSTIQNPSETSMERPMNTDFFSSTKNPDSETSELLTQRLYVSSAVEEAPPSQTSVKDPNSLLNELKKLVKNEYQVESPIEVESSNRFSLTPLEDNFDAVQTLELQIKKFQSSQSKALSNYHIKATERSEIPDNCLYILEGWKQGPLNTSNFIPETDRKTSGGFYLRWNGKGIVVNPGPHFLDYFHEQGLSLKDIDFVIVTRDSLDAYQNVKEIYALNTQLNKLHSEFQVIHYYLNQQVYQKMAPHLKPNFKQERNTVHALELFLDSPDVEKIELTPEICLHYFPISKQETFHPSLMTTPGSISCLGIKFELKFPSTSFATFPETKNVGYISGSGWSPLLAHYMGSCDVLIAGFGNTTSQDYRKLKYNDDCLGFFGSFSLIEEVNPTLFLCCEFGGREGDIRLEILHLLRQEYAKLSSRKPTTIFPGDIGLFVDLETSKLRCSLTQTLVDPASLRVVKSKESFGSLHYLGPNSFY